MVGTALAVAQRRRRLASLKEGKRSAVGGSE